MEMSHQQNKPDFRELDFSSSTVPLPPRRSSDSVATSAPVNPCNRQNVKAINHSGELDTRRSSPSVPSPKPGHRRSASTGSPLIYSGASSSGSSGGSGCSGGGGASSVSISSPGARRATSSSAGTDVSSGGHRTARVTAGNICPSGMILKSNMVSRAPTRPEKLGSGTVNYGHGSIIRGGVTGARSALETRLDPEEVKREGNEMYKKGNFVEALVLYDKAISLSPENAAYRSNKAAALVAMGRFWEAVRECEVAVKLDSGYDRAHQRLASLFLRLGQVENARHHLYFNGQPNNKTELQKLLLVEKHINRCVDARKIGDWKSVLRECEAAMVAGADSSPQIIACKGEAFVKLHQLENADSSLSSVANSEPYPASCSQTKFFGMLSEAYLHYVRALVDMAFGRFENAIAAADKASKIDHNNVEVALLLSNIKFVTRARSRGKDLFDAGRYSEASVAYGEGLRYDLSNSVLYCNRAICWSKLGLWEQSVEDCNQALKIHPNYTKALLRRAASNAKLERWGSAVRDYEVLKKELPGDSEVTESLLRAQNALKKLQLEEVNTRAS